MKEVSCRAFEALYRAVRDGTVPEDALLAGIPYSLDYLQDRHERMEWAVWCHLVANARPHLQAEDFERLGADFARSLSFRAILLIARILYRPVRFLQWMQSMQREGHAMFSCVHSESTLPSPNRFVLTLTLDSSLEDCPEFFYITKGTMQVLPKMLGSTNSKMTFSLGERCATYDMYVPPREGLVQRVRRWVAVPLRAQEAADEIHETHDLLQQNYAALKRAQEELDRQAQQLRVAHRINEALQQPRSLTDVVQAVGTSLMSELGLKGLTLSIQGDYGPQCLHQPFGQPVSSVSIVRTLTVQNRTVGEVQLFGEVDNPELAATVDFVLPAIRMAVENALHYDSLLHYRDELEDRVAKRTAALQSARDDLSRSVQALETAQAAREKIFANINHEIRTPLSIVRLAVDEACSSQAAGDAAGFVRCMESINRNVERLLTLVDNLLTLASVDAGSLRLQRRRVDLGALLESEVRTWHPLARQSEITLSCNAVARVSVNADPHALGRVISNLLSNAIKFTPAGGQIEATLRYSANRPTVIVRDSGIGIDEDFSKSAFDRFSQGPEPVRPSCRGTGIGLAIVREVVEAHGGEVSVKPAEGGGSCFSFSLPEDSVVDETEEPIAFSARSSLSPASTTTRPSTQEFVGPDDASYCVLVAEDEPELLDAMVRCLEPHFRVLSATSGECALSLAEKFLPDLLVTDIAMPKMDGIELIRRFSAIPQNRAARALLVTAESSILSRLEAFEAGAIDYITKPFEGRELVARVRAQLSVRDTMLRLHDAEKLTSMGVMGAGLAHDIRNPLHVIQNLLGPMRKKLNDNVNTIDASVFKMLDFIGESAKRIGDISASILSFENPGDLFLEPVDARSLIERVVRTTPNPSGAEVRIECDDSLLCACSRVHIEQVLSNLLANGLHAAGLRGCVRITATEFEDEVVVKVADNGPGIALRDHERVFMPFFTTRAPGEGSGLGLAISRSIVQRHGGTLRVLQAREGCALEMRIPKQYG